MGSGKGSVLGPSACCIYVVNKKLNDVVSRSSAEGSRCRRGALEGIKVISRSHTLLNTLPLGNHAAFLVASVMQAVLLPFSKQNEIPDAKRKLKKFHVCCYISRVLVEVLVVIRCFTSS